MSIPRLDRGRAIRALMQKAEDALKEAESNLQVLASITVELEQENETLKQQVRELDGLLVLAREAQC